MEPIQFPEQNSTYGAEQQDLYLSLPGHFMKNDPQGRAIFCWKLSPDEIGEVVRTGVIWHSVLTFNHPLQPQWLQADRPTFPPPYFDMVGGCPECGRPSEHEELCGPCKGRETPRIDQVQGAILNEVPPAGDPPTVIIEDVFGVIGFRVQFSHRPHWCDVIAWEMNGREDDTGLPVFDHGMGGWTHDHKKAEPYLDGFVKWDGCSELDQGKPHWCGPEGFQRHADLLRYIYNRAIELMNSDEGDEWPEPAAPNPQPVP